MAATMATTMALMNAKCLSTNSSKLPSLKPIKPISLNIPKATLTNSTALAGAIFATISVSEPALAAQQIAQIAEGDNRGLALLLPIIPAIAWVLFNIFQPALNQINRMVNKSSVVVGALGLTGLAASGFLSTPEASANEMIVLGEAAAKAGDNRGQLLLIVVAPAILWVLYNIPAACFEPAEQDVSGLIQWACPAFC